MSVKRALLSQQRNDMNDSRALSKSWAGSDPWAGSVPN